MDVTQFTTAPSDGPVESVLRQGSALISRYELLEEVGRGGMGIVYRARHKNLDMQVAVKINLPGTSAARFLREAQLLALIKSPHVVAVHDFDILPNGCPMLVMEWVEGTDLAQVIRAEQGAGLPEEGFPPAGKAGVLAWMCQAAEGMRAAAEQGVVHRDLKPANVLLDEHEQPKVTDFGLAKLLATDSGQTRTGAVVGTPSYMSPEQA
jgi:eukaryotic-like serine/threonine-protein kinase